MSETTVKGLADLQKFLDQLPAKLEANIMRSALAAGARVIAREAKQNVPVAHGDLRASIRVSSRLKGGKATASVKAGSKKAWYWRFVEFGTASHGVKKGASRRRGKYQDGKLHPGANPRPFMRPAFDSQSAAAIEAVAEQIKKRLSKQGLVDARDVDIGVGA